MIVKLTFFGRRKIIRESRPDIIRPNGVPRQKSGYQGYQGDSYQFLFFHHGYS